MKIGILQTAPNNCEALNRLARLYPGVQLIHYVDECVWEHVLAAGGQVTDKCHQILADDFNKLLDAGCDRLGLLCSLVKPGIEKVQAKVPVPIVVYDDVQARLAVAATPVDGCIGVVAMKETPLAPSKLAVEQAARQAGKRVMVQTICVESAANCLKETGDTALADQYFERWLRRYQEAYSAFVIPQVPLTRIMPRIRDLETPVFDSMEPFMKELAKK